MFGVEKVHDFRLEQTGYQERGMSLSIRDDEKNLSYCLERYAWIEMSPFHLFRNQTSSSRLEDISWFRRK